MHVQGVKGWVFSAAMTPLKHLRRREKLTILTFWACAERYINLYEPLARFQMIRNIWFTYAALVNAHLAFEL